MEPINEASIRRAKQTIRCLPFNENFYSITQKKGLSAEVVMSRKIEYCSDGKKWFKRLIAVEKAFRYLIKIGILRREVDGQGLTSKIRLTPLGRQIMEDNEMLLHQKPKKSERIRHFFLYDLSLQ